MGVKMIFKILSIFRNIIVFPLAVVHSILATNIGLVMIPLISASFVFYKCLIILLAKCVMPSSKRVSSVQDSVMAARDMNKDIDLYMSLHMYFEGRIDYEGFIEVFNERVMKKTLPNGDLKFPELEYFIEPFMGYLFYKKDEKFDLRNHIQIYKGNPSEIVNRKKLDKIVHDFTHELYPVKRSPWGILIVNHVILDEEDGKEYSLVLHKHHHSLGDAYAILLVYWETLLQQDMQAFKKTRNSKPPSKLEMISSVCGAARDFYWTVMKLAFDIVYSNQRFIDQNSWHSPKKESDHIHTTIPPIETSLVKKISSECKVSISTVLMAIVNGGLRRMMEANGHSKGPKNIRTVISLPVPNHPQKLTNHSSIAFLDVNFSCSDEKKRLGMIEKNLITASRWSVLFGLPFLSFFLKPIPFAWIRSFPPTSERSLGCTAFFASILIPTQSSTEEGQLMGCRATRVYATLEQSNAINNIASTVVITKYKDAFYINYTIQKHLLKSEDQIYEIEKYVMDELSHLKSSLLEKESHVQTLGSAEKGYDNVTFL